MKTKHLAATTDIWKDGKKSLHYINQIITALTKEGAMEVGGFWRWGVILQ